MSLALFDAVVEFDGFAGCNFPRAFPFRVDQIWTPLGQIWPERPSSKIVSDISLFCVCLKMSGNTRMSRLYSAAAAPKRCCMRLVVLANIYDVGNAAVCCCSLLLLVDNDG